MKSKRIITAICAIFCLVILSTCFSPWDGSDGNGTISINLGSSARALVGNSELAEMEYTIILTSLDKEQKTDPVTLAKGKSSAVIPVPPGDWKVEVRAVGNTPESYNEDDDFVPLEDPFPPRMLRGIGETSKPVSVRLGLTTPATIEMDIATEVKNWDQLLSAIRNADTEGRKEYVVIAKDLEADKLTAYVGSWNGEEKKNIILCADADAKITREDSFIDTLFHVYGEATLTLGGLGEGTITLEGNIYLDPGDPEPSTLISVEGGSLIMNEGVTLTGNRNTMSSSGGRGGAVLVDPYKDNSGTVIVRGTFTMEGGTISGNIAPTGGGVCVGQDCTFTMKGGIISRNEADSISDGRGGGVHIDPSGIFIKTGGTIYGNNDEDEDLMNRAEMSGHAVYISNPPINRNKTVGPLVFYNDQDGFSDEP